MVNHHCSSMTSITTPPHFRLLLHGQDGAIPYLTPELMRLVFCPPDETDCKSADGSGDSEEEKQVWKYHRQHFILGVAVKDTCITAVYRDANSKDNKKRKNDGSFVNDHSVAKKVKVTVSPNPNPKTDDSSSNNNDCSSACLKQEVVKKDNSTNAAKKPAGYTFLTPSWSSQICNKINSHLPADGKDNTTGKDTSNYMHTHLRIPEYITTMIVPTFPYDRPEDDQSSSTSDVNNMKNGEDDNKKQQYIPKKQQEQPQEGKQKQAKQKKNDSSMPNSTKDCMPLDTPHGWQKIQPVQYWDAVSSLTISPTSSSPSNVRNSKETIPPCEGAVGLFDHMNLSRDQANCMFARENDDDNVLTSQAQKSVLESEIAAANIKKGKWDSLVQRLVQRTNDWSHRVMSYRWDQKSSINFWMPIHMASSHLPLDYMFARPRSSNSNQSSDDNGFLLLSKCWFDVAIVGWDTISYNREYRRQALRSIMKTVKVATGLGEEESSTKYVILAVNDIQSILDAAREGVSIIGTDIVRLWSRGGIALCLDMSLDNNSRNNNEKKKENNMGGKLDLSKEQFARDSSALLPGCQCVACRPRQINTSTGDVKKMVPSFTRAYIHHLIKANEMLAETLLFVHNLHQMLLLFRNLSMAASLDKSETNLNERENFETYCQKLEKQLCGTSEYSI